MLNSNADWCCSAVDLYKGTEKGGFNSGTPLTPGFSQALGFFGFGDFERTRHDTFRERRCDCEVGLNGCPSQCSGKTYQSVK